MKNDNDTADLSQLILDNANLLVFTWDFKGRIKSFNAYAERLTGYKEDEVLGRSWIDLFIEEDKGQKDKISGLVKYVKGGKSLNNIIGNIWRVKEDETIELAWKTCPIFDQNENVVEIISFGTDVTEYKGLIKELNTLAYYDDLTGLPNWKSAEEKINKLMENLNNKNIKLVLVAIDIDNFKEVNDSIGFEAANNLLVFIGNILKKNQDIYYAIKFNEDEFGVILYDIEDKEDATRRIERLMEDISRPWCADGYELQVSVSMGVSVFPNNGKNLSDLKKCANMAMNKVKENGKNDYMFYHKSMKKEVEKNIFIINNMKDSINKDYFFLYYQPVVDLKDKKIYGLEALIRWDHPKKGLIPPMDFIPLIEESGQIVDLTSMVFRKAFKQKRLWNKKGYGDFKLAINISIKSFIKGDLYEEIKRLLEDYNIGPQEIVLEITETALIDNIDLCGGTLERLRKLGVGLALDDFGTGYSSLARLNKLPLEYLKIDKEFIDKLKAGTSEEVLVTYVIELAHRLNLKVVAEGVETKEQEDMLRDINCNFSQGYYFAKPMLGKDIERKFLSRGEER